ncbi:bifunctional phosphopantothenoylcysteine decarboxylase/phosphopantothenate--cysteine ligase CoaBC [uncultured Serinicoccus sp.]|uniref:bifunctional phosphopantothenoylcysteine decarboxylase/phosphopantothenate--cysteine ligase CoaBC n=1 Tax=uncultured Serinicoccus sp. TaxID=735514 RepID=UPI0026077888|nr:bifunctional phosphopantothenoylcysteine decarboxylase/phosphopantothenate--cysteine ligase CoaBC [uncultured Serinicoccus sp.]
MRVVLGVAGGIAAYKACSVLRLLAEAGHEVTVVPTASALRFVGAPTWEALSGRPVSSEVWDDVPQVPHVRLGQQADLVLVAPATADLLARAAHGLADDLLTSTLLTARCPVVLAPAMHTEMWLHPATATNVEMLRSRGVRVVEPASGRLTGADTGPGRLPEPEDIVAAAFAAVRESGRDGGQPGDLEGRHVVVTAGGTREPLDPVRFLGNRSSGKQGYAVAAEAAARGARVSLVSANVSLAVPAGCDLLEVGTALELQEGVASVLEAGDVDAVVMAAAVADFRPAAYAEAKIKKTHGPDDEGAPTIELVRNPDVLADLVSARGDDRRPYLIGFAAETGDATGDVLALARAKLERKGCDLLVANEVGADKTFGRDDTTVHLLHPGESQADTVGPTTKAQVARAIWDHVAPALG